MRPAVLAAAVATVACTAGGPASAQTAQVRGRIVDADGGAALGGATVALTALGAAAPVRRSTTADDGFFLLVDVPAGRYVLGASAPGYATATDTLTLGPGQRRIRGLALRPLALDEVLVERAPVALAGAARLDAADLAAFPTVVPGGDAGVALAALPGVVAFEDGGGLFVRGGEATHVLYRVEGVPVYQPVHSLGPLLAIPADAIAYVDLTPGALPERLGGRAGAAVEVGLRGGDRERFVARGRAGTGLGAALGTLHTEIPVLPGRASLTLSGRGQVFGRARVAAGAPASTADAAPTGERRFDVADGLVRLHAFATPLVTLSGLALVSHDAVEAPYTDGRRLRLTTANRAAGGTFAYLPEQYPLRTEVRVFVSQLRTVSERPAAAGGLDTRTSDADAYGGEIALAYLLGPQRVTFGLFATSQRLASTGISTTEAPPGSGQPRTEEFVTEGGAWVGARVDAGRWGTVEPGVRVHGFPSRARLSVEPRGRWTVPLGTGTKAGRAFVAGGVQAQEVGGFLLSPGAADAFVAVVPTAADRPPVRSVHAEAGAAQPLGRRAALDAAAWLRRTDHLGLDGRTRAAGAGADLRLDVRGVRVAGRALALRLAYGLSRVRYRAADGTSTPPPFDRLHTGDLAARLDLPAGLRLDAHVRAGTGTPFQRTGGFGDEPVDLRDPFGPTRPVAFGSDAVRLPSTLRADVALAYTRRLAGLDIEATAGLRNATGHRTVASIDPLTFARLDAPGRTVTVGVSVGWR